MPVRLPLLGAAVNTKTALGIAKAPSSPLPHLRDPRQMPRTWGVTFEHSPFQVSDLQNDWFSLRKQYRTEEFRSRSTCFEGKWPNQINSNFFKLHLQDPVMEPQFPTQCLALNPELHGPVLDSVSQQGLQAAHASWASWLPGRDGRQGQGLG